MKYFIYNCRWNFFYLQSNSLRSSLRSLRSSLRSWVSLRSLRCPYYPLRSQVSKSPSLSEWSLTDFSAIESKQKVKSKRYVSESVSQWVTRVGIELSQPHAWDTGTAKNVTHAGHQQTLDTESVQKHENDKIPWIRKVSGNTKMTKSLEYEKCLETGKWQNSLVVLKTWLTRGPSWPFRCLD